MKFNFLQGDGIGLPEIKKISEAVIAAGYSASNVAFGMGSGLLQKLNRDTMSFATKLCYIEYAGTLAFSFILCESLTFSFMY